MRWIGAYFTLGFSLFVSAQAIAKIEPPVLRVSRETEPTTLDWNNYHTGSDRYVISLLMRGLLKYESEGGKSAAPVCDLCKSFQVSSDGKILTFSIKADESWSDGVRLEAQHFVDSFRRLLDPSNRFETAADFQIIAGAVQSGKNWDPKKLLIRAEGKEKLEITLSRPSGLFPHLLTTTPSYPIRKEFLKKKDLGESHATSAVIGAYQLAAWERGKRLVMEGNPHYKGKRPVYRVDLVFGSHQELFKRFQSGKLDIFFRPTMENIMAASKKKLQVNPFWASRLLYLNTKRRPLSDVNFRKAILLALDRDALPATLQNGERKTTGVIPPGLVGYRELPLVTMDLNQAKVERARTLPEQKPVTLELLARDTTTNKQVVQWLSGQLEKIQIKLKPKFKNGSDYVKSLEAGDFDLATFVWAYTLATPLDLLRTFVTGVPSNRVGWTHVTYDDMVELLFGESKPTEFASLVDQATQILESQSVGVIPLSYPTQPYLLGPRVLSFFITPFGDPDLSRIELRQ